MRRISDQEEYERKRQENIRHNQELLKALNLQDLSRSLRPAPKAVKPSQRKREKKPSSLPTRSSLRLQGIQAVSEVETETTKEDVKREAPEDTISPAKRARMSDDCKLCDISLNNGNDSLMILDTVRGLTKVLETIPLPNDEDFKTLKRQVQKLEIRHRWSTVKVTPERIYSVAMHPSPEKMIGFAGDKIGVLGVWEIDNEKEPFEEGEDVEPVVNSFRVHSNSPISTVQFRPTDWTKVLTSSYNGSIRQLDLTKGISSEVMVLTKGSKGEGHVCCMDCAPDGYSLWASDIEGRIFHRDLRTKFTSGDVSNLDIYSCHEKKVGGISLNPTNPHLLCTSSLDKTMRIWDLRKVESSQGSKHPVEVYSVKHRLSVSSAYWTPRGDRIVSTSYDDALRVWDFDDVAKWKPGETIDERDPSAKVNHNNQTGKWVTLFRARWHPSTTVRPHFVVGNMSRTVDIYDYTGALLTQLRDSERITAIPAVNMFHPALERILSGNASGKMVFWS